ncbi:unnamed protein product, partial [Ectocarpus sp. 4 AP-2014]
IARHTYVGNADHAPTTAFGGTGQIPPSLGRIQCTLSNGKNNVRSFEVIVRLVYIRTGSGLANQKAVPRTTAVSQRGTVAAERATETSSKIKRSPGELTVLTRVKVR